MQGFPNEQISKSEILDMVCAMRSFEKNQWRNVEEWLQSNACEVGFQHQTDRCQCCHCCETEEDKSEICTAMRRSLNSSQKQAIITIYFSK
jgi:hypothetical protein